ncbi:MAG: hypothetical protein WKH64_17640, partial [Chloroflexia bacterium]
ALVRSVQTGSPGGGQPQGAFGSGVEELELLLLVPDEEELLLNVPELLLLDEELLLEDELLLDELLLDAQELLLIDELLLDGRGPPMLDDDELELGMTAALRKAKVPWHR